MPKSKSKSKSSSRKLDWSRYTNFSAQNSRKDLVRLCAKLKSSQLEDVFSSPDKTGLYPIHWVAIHNRSDFIEFMIDKGSPVKIKCLNKMLANGTALHLAAMNGCIEAIAMLLNKTTQALTTTKETVPKSLTLEEKPASEKGQSTSWLDYRDAEGQTPLMRSAAPRSKRMDTFRDLLRKNLWSLSGRPSETALFLINKGAKWREVDGVYGMNLMHLAVINNYDDIVDMLLFIDPDLISTPTKVPREIKKVHIKESSPMTANFTAIQLEPPTPTPSNQQSPVATSESNTSIDNSSTMKPLISKQESRRSLVSSGLMPLQLAILYGRIKIIRSLWRAENYNELNVTDDIYTSKRYRRKEDELISIITKVFWSSRTELLSYMRTNFLKLALAIDTAVLALVWVPAYLTNSHKKVNLGNGIFIVAFSLTIAMVSRVISKDPGYLKRNTVEYSIKMKKIISYPKSAGSGTKADLERLQEQKQEPTSIDQPEQGEKNNVQMANDIDIADQVRVLCHRCRCVRQERSRHCSHCNRCIQDFDHHCMYLGSCIGRNNRIDFLLMQMFLTLTAIYGTVIMASSLQRNEWRQVAHFVGFIWIFKYVVIGCISTFLNLRRAAQGVTMYEMIRSNRIRKIFGSKGTPEEISESHKNYSNKRGSFWRYSPDRFLTGDLPLRKVLDNLKEFANYYSYE